MENPPPPASPSLPGSGGPPPLPPPPPWMTGRPPASGPSVGLILAIVLPVVGLFIIGILAAVAIPAFIKYTRRAKTSEARMNVRKLFDDSVSYYEEEHAGPDGRILPRQFPAAVGWTPPESACGSPTAKFLPNPSLWNPPTWQALHFTLEDPHYYQYRVESSGTGADATITVSAQGDLNCNGVFSLYQRTATVGPDGSVSGGSGMFTRNELE